MLAVHHPGYEGLVRCERAWRELSAATGSARFFHAYDWYGAFFAHLQPANEPMGVIELRDDGHCVGLFPYLHRRIRKGGIDIQVLSLPDSAHLILTDLVLTDRLDAPACLRAMHECLARDHIGWHALLFPHVLADSHAVRFARGLGARAIVRSGGGSRYFDATQPYEPLSSQFAGRLRKNIKKGRKRLEQTGEIEFLCISGADERMSWAFDRFVALEAGGWKGETGTASAIALSEALMSFYRDLIRASSDPMRLEIHLLCLDGKPIAAQLATVCGPQRSIHKIAYDESFQHASPGTVLMANTLERSCRDETLHSLSLVTDMPWMRDWNAHNAAVCEVWVPRSALLGALARAAVRTRRLWPARSHQAQASP